MDEQGNYHECDACDYETGVHECACGCGNKHRPPTEAECLAHDAEVARDEAAASAWAHAKQHAAQAKRAQADEEQLASIRRRLAERDRQVRKFGPSNVGASTLYVEYHRDVSVLLDIVERLQGGAASKDDYIGKLHAHRQTVIRDLNAYEEELRRENDQLRSCLAPFLALFEGLRGRGGQLPDPDGDMGFTMKRSAVNEILANIRTAREAEQEARNG